MIKLLGIGSSPRTAEPHAMYDSLSTIMLILNLYGFILPPQAFVYHTGHSMQSMEEVCLGFYENQWLLKALENLGDPSCNWCSWPQMPKVLHKDNLHG